MKTYFLSWQSDNMRGHTTAEAGDDVNPKEALNKMLEAVKEKFGEQIKGSICAVQFNNVI